MASRKHRRIAALGLFLVAAVAGGYLLWRPGQVPPAVGVVRATEIRVAPEVGGQLATIKVQKGAWVRAGDVVAELSALELTASVAQARAALAAAAADRDHVYAGVRAEEVAALAAEIAKAKSRLAYAELQLNRVAQLARGDIASQQTLDQAENDVASARSDVAEAEANHAAAEAGPTREQRAIADAQVKAAASALAVLERRLEKTNLRPAGARDRGNRQAVAVVQRAGRCAARPQAGSDGRRRAAGCARSDTGRGHRAPAARSVRDLASRTRGRRSRSQYAAPAPRSPRRFGRVGARHDGLAGALSVSSIPDPLGIGGILWLAGRDGGVQEKPAGLGDARKQPSLTKPMNQMCGVESS